MSQRAANILIAGLLLIPSPCFIFGFGIGGQRFIGELARIALTFILVVFIGAIIAHALLKFFPHPNDKIFSVFKGAIISTIPSAVIYMGFASLLFIYQEPPLIFETEGTLKQPTLDSNWRDIGEMDAQTKACIAPTAEEYYQERQMEFGGTGGIFSEGSLKHVLNELPYGDCSNTGQEFPIYKITQCTSSIAFANSGGFTLSDEYFSTETGELVYAKTNTDFNAFCHNASFDVSYGEKPTNECKTTKVSYCNISQEEIMNIYDSGDFDQIAPAILAAQNE